MLLTIEEAKTKWCPQVRMLSSYDYGENGFAASYNRDENAIPYGTYCLADKCMMWRWSSGMDVTYYSSSEGGGARVQRGYCGLSGKCEK